MEIGFIKNILQTKIQVLEKCFNQTVLLAARKN